MADAATIAVLLSAKDEASAKLKQVGDNMGRLGKTFADHSQKMGMAMVGVGAGIQVLAKQQQELTESARKLAYQTGFTEKEIRGFATSLSNATFPLDSAINLMMLASQQGLDSEKALKDYAKFWDTIGDATGGSADQMAKLGAALAAVGISAGDEAKLLNAFGLITRETTSSVNDFLTVVSILAEDMGLMGMSVDDAAVMLTAMEKELGIVGRAARTTFREAMTQSEDGLDGVRDSLGLTEDQLEKYRVKLLESGNVMGDQAAIYASTMTMMDDLKSTMEDLTFAHGGHIEKAAQLAPLLIAAGTATAGLTTAFRLLEPVIFRMRLAFISLNLSMGVIAVGVIAIGAAITAGFLIWKNWDKVVEKSKEILKVTWEKIKEFTEVGVNFVIRLMNDLTWIFRKQFATIGDLVARLLELGSHLPFVGDSFKKGADAVRGFSDKLEEGIPQIDITSEKQAELQVVLDDTSTAFEETGAVVAEESDKMASTVERDVNRVSDAYTESLKDRITYADQILEIQASQYKVEMQAQADKIQATKDAFWADNAEREKMAAQHADNMIAEQQRIADEQERAHQRQQDSWTNFERSLDPTMETIKEAGLDFRGVLEKMAEATDLNLETIAAGVKGQEVVWGDTWGLINSTLFKNIDEMNLGIKKLEGEADRVQEKFQNQFSIQGIGQNPSDPDPQRKARADQIAQNRAREIHMLAAESYNLQNTPWGHPKMTGDWQSRKTEMEDRVRMLQDNVNRMTREIQSLGFSGAFANGGIVGRGGLALVGERGPELVSLPGGSMVHPNGTGPGGTNNFHFHGAVYGVEDLKETVVQAVRDHAISGGFSGVFGGA